MNKTCISCDKPRPLLGFLLGWGQDKGGTTYCPAHWKEEKAYQRERKRENEVSRDDLKAMEQYLNYLAVQWWSSQTRSQATCDYCSRGISKDRGYLVGYPGSTLICGGCWTENAPRLRKNPNYFGHGLLKQARAHANNRG